MLRFVALCSLLVFCHALPPVIDESFKPFAYSYQAPAEGGQHSATQAADGTGKVTGSYALADEDGRQRVVEYVADELGFRANIRTNEPGTQADSPADVQLDANPIQVAEPVRYAARPAPVRVVPAAPVAAPVVAPVAAPVVAARPVAYSAGALRYAGAGYPYGYSPYRYAAHPHAYGYGYPYGYGHGHGFYPQRYFY